MLLLNTLTNKIEQFADAASAPAYAAVSYLWPQQGSFAWTTTPSLVTAAAAVATATTTTAPFESKWPIPSCSPETLDAALRAIYVGGASVLDYDAQVAAGGPGANPASPTAPPRFTHIWMDVLCIPQNDDAAKAVEVSHMGSYYRNATCVWVFLDDLGKPSIPLQKGQKPARWFTRLWTLQECILPRKLFVYVKSGQPSSPKKPSITSFLSSRQVDQTLPEPAPVWMSRKHVIAYICVSCQMEVLSGSMTNEFALTVGLQLLPLGVTNPSVRTALLLSSVRTSRFAADRLYGVLGVLPSDDPEAFDHTKIHVDYQKPFAEVAADFAQAMGPSVVKQFGTVAPAPPELRHDAFVAEVAAGPTATASSTSYFGSFEPGFFINGSMRRDADPSEIRRILADNSFAYAFDDKDRSTCKTDGMQFLDHDVRPVVTRQGVHIPAARVAHVARFTGLGHNQFLSQPVSFFTELLDLLTFMVETSPPLLSWARNAIIAYENQYKTHSFVDLASGRVLASLTIWLAKLSKSITPSFAYPKYVKRVEILTANGRLLSGIADDANTAAEIAAGKQIVLALVGTSISCDGKNRFSDDYAVCVLLEPLKEGRPMVLKKVGVYHNFSYNATADGRQSGTRPSAADNAALFDDFSVHDVLIT
ncbi:hypothetical protein DFJ73DRAFT_131221 [Zopfochytrium polystomum]|nr:hypothetical protein DFJ73DRAFT_131221 [Zopfochytrium polystomum]